MVNEGRLTPEALAASLHPEAHGALISGLYLTGNDSARQHVRQLAAGNKRLQLQQTFYSTVKRSVPEEHSVSRSMRLNMSEKSFPPPLPTALKSPGADRARAEPLRSTMQMAEELPVKKRKTSEGAAEKPAGDTEDLSDPLLFLEHLYDNPYTPEFKYLRPIVCDEIPVNPYHLEIVSHGEIDENDFFTMSSSGVTHFRNGVPTFTSLEQWEREYHLFNHIIQIPLFKKYRIWKAFQVWRRNVRGKKTMSCRQALTGNLFILNPIFQVSLLRVRQLCVEVSQRRLYSLLVGKLYTLEDFVVSQADQRDEVGERLVEFAEELVNAVRHACISALSALEERLFGGGANVEGEEADPAMGNGAGNGGGMSPRLGASGSVAAGSGLAAAAAKKSTPRNAKQEGPSSNLTNMPSKFSYTVMAAKRVEHRHLLRYIRLADYVVFDALQNVVIDSLREVLEFMRTVKKNVEQRVREEAEKKKAEAEADPNTKEEDDENAAAAAEAAKAICPVFTLEVLYAEEGSGGHLFFSPSSRDFLVELETVTTGFVDVVSDMPRLLGHDSLTAFTELAEADFGNREEDSSLSDRIYHDPAFKDLLQNLKEMIADAFEDATRKREGFNPFVEMVHENAMLDIDQVRRDAEDKAIGLSDFRQDMEKFGHQKQDIASLPTVIDNGLLRLDSKKLKETFMPSPEECLDKIHDLLPQLGKNKFDVLMAQINEANSVLTKTPANVDEFVALLEFLDRTLERKDELEAEFQEVTTHYRLMDDFDVKVPELDKAGFATLVPEYTQFKVTIDVVDATREENMAKFSQELDDHIKTLHKDTNKLRDLAQDELIFEDTDDMKPVLNLVEELKSQANDLDSRGKKINRYQEMFRIDPVRFEELEEVVTEVTLKRNLWVGLKEWSEMTAEWSEKPFCELDPEDIANITQRYHKMCFQCEKGLPPNQPTRRLRGLVDTFKQTIPVVQDFCNQRLQSRHWDKIEQTVGNRIEPTEEFTLQRLLDMHIMEFKDDIGQISMEATQEYGLEEMLSKVVRTWLETDFVTNPYKDQKDVWILGGVDDIIALLDDSMMTMGSITASRFVAGIRTAVDEMEQKLHLFSETLDEWLQCQRNWMYLESIFYAPDIQRQLPSEAKMFMDVDKEFKEIMKRTHDFPNAMAACTNKAGLLEQFQRYNETLDKIQKSLEDYLETKRMAFPRFYFLSNDELLEILAQARNPRAVQPHISKCFDGIKALDFGDDVKSNDILAMISPEGEVVKLGKNLKARGTVEGWLLMVESDMRKTLQRCTKDALRDYAERPRHEWFFDHPAQVIILVSQVYWCRGVTEALTSENPKEALNDFKEHCFFLLGKLIELVRGQLTKLQRRALCALITIDVHARDIVCTLVNQGVIDENDFSWQQQLRPYWDETQEKCIIRQTNASFFYGYESLGASGRLVVTPLTDRCYMTLTGALHLKYGGAPAGPAGTGKTETTKDLSKALGYQCVVFNCGDNLDYKFTGRFFAGLAQCGAWACFDEFNRIGIEVLSVVAQQMLSIVNALKAEVSKFVFEGREIKLVSSFGVFITMNPGYAGRTELPDNLKALFRPVSMMIPDYGLVAEVMLFSEGFGDAKTLSRKMVKLYKLSSEQLSQQDHYDFGMRAVKSVLVMAGSLKRANAELPEDIVLIRALRDSNLPKFLSEDVILFQAIIQDLFPGVEIPEHDFGELQDHIEAAIEDHRLQIVPPFVKKVIQLYETFQVRFGVMLVGPTGGGKTTIYKILQRAMTTLRESGSANESFQTVHTYCLNPKCITMGELYGEYNEITNEWRDGLASSIMRSCVQDESNDRKWVVFDGPVDAIWIENMNTVLDDNCMLCLPNSERIKLQGEEMRMLFEVEDLAVASPATVSRCGMVYVPPEEMGWRPYVRSWLDRVGQRWPSFPAVDPDTPASSLSAGEHLWERMNQIIDASLEHVRANCKEDIPSVDINLVASCCSMVESMFTAENGVDFGAPRAQLFEALDKVLFFCIVWSIGGNLDPVGKESFDYYAREHLESLSALPPMETVYDYFYDYKDSNFRLWKEIVPEFKYDTTTPYFQMLVPTADTVRMQYLLQAELNVNKPVLFVGHSGVGKSVIVADLINRISEQGTIPIVTVFSAQTSSKQTQELLESKLEKKRKGVFGAGGGKKFLLFVDDVNMPMREVYGAQPPIELLRQLQDFGGFYDRQKLFWKTIQDITLVSACGPPGGGRNPVTARFFRHFHMMNLPPASEQVQKHIFTSILGGFLEAFNSEVKPLCKAMVDSSVEVYTRIKTELLPTPAKSHYTFNLRDLSKVFQGILRIKPQNCNKADIMINLWVHESMRVFHDRLVFAEDTLYFKNLVHEMLRRHFSVDWSFEQVFEGDPVVFGDYLRPGCAREDRVYEKVQDIAKLSMLLDGYLDEYNASTSSPMNLVFFLDAIEHVSRITRILTLPRGNAMLVGVGGSGKQSLTRLACYIAEYKCFQIELRRGYALSDFREDIKNLYRTAGVDGEPMTFLLTDNQIVNETFLEDVNNILNTGEVPGLFANDEKEKIISDVRPIVEETGMAPSKDNCYNFFIDRVRSNLHVVLAMSPVGDAFRNRCRLFPALISCTTIDWFHGWPEAALLSVSKRFLESEDLGSSEINDQVANMCVTIHMSVKEAADRFFAELRRKYYTTPKSYLDLIALYTTMLKEKRQEVVAARDRLVNGLTRLEETNTVVDSMKDELTKLEPVLKEKQIATEALLKQVSVDQAKAEKIKAVVGAEEAEVKKQVEATQEIKDDAQRDLDAALPALEEAVASLNALSKADIVEVKSFSKPPQLVQVTMEAVCTLFGVPPSWDNSKKILSDPKFMRNLIEFDKDNIPAAYLKKLKKYIEIPDFTPEQVGNVSKAAMSLCMWVRAMDVYSAVAKVVAPKKAKLAKAESELEEVQSALAEKQGALNKVIEEVDQLRKRLEEAENEKISLQENVELTAKRLDRAGRLTSSLGDESVRWKAQADILKQQLDLLVGDVFLSAACISYYGAFTGPYRNELVTGWVQGCKERGIPVSGDYALCEVMCTPVRIREWQIWGLPSDPLSTDNGILVTRGKRWPLMIDPQGQANKWVKQMEAKNGLKLIKLTDPNFLKTLENCIRFGNPVLLEDIGEELDPSLEPVLLKAVYRRGKQLLLRLGDQDIDYDPNFKFYMTTKMSNPHYLPEICIKVTIINFTVTLMGLEDQLLADVVRKERPDLEEQNDRLVVSLASDQKQLKDLEDKVLKLLAASEGNILDDEVLINTLNNSKLTSGVIKERVKEAESTRVEISAARESYRTVSTRGSLLYFVVADMAEVDPMYQYSLEYFKRLFNSCLELSQKSDVLETRLDILKTFTTDFLYKNVCRGLFEKDKLIYSFLICSSILRHADEIGSLEWSFLLRGGVMHKDTQLRPNPDPTWIQEKVWENLHALEDNVPVFAGITAHVIQNASDWKGWFSSPAPHEAPLPGEWLDMLDSFQRLLVVKVFREEKVVFGISNYVAEKLGKEFTESPPFSLADIYKDSDYKTPIIFVLSTGADPTSSLLRFASEMEYTERLSIISLGQGQGPVATRMIQAASRKGDWVCLQNCHLAQSWMLPMQKIIEGFASQDADISEDFRLFLTSMPAKHFPVQVLQNGIKLTTEPPKGLRANLLRSYAEVKEEYFESCTKPHAWKKLLFGLCFIHGIVQERRKFGPIGWNIRYEFNTSDRDCAMMTLRMFLEENDEIPWQTLNYVVGEINYGGRVTDDQDRRCLLSIILQYFQPAILDDAYKFSPSGNYYAPVDGELASYEAYVRQLPAHEDPEVFGMHENAELSFQLQETRAILGTILDLQPRATGTSAGKSPDEIVDEMAESMLNDLPDVMTRAEAKSGTFDVGENGQVNSLTTVLSQEMERFNKLLKVIKKSLVDLRKAIKGFVVMSAELENIHTCFLNNQVPGMWAKAGYPSLKPLASWVKDFHERLTFMRSWLTQGQPNCYWLPGFFFPQGFMTGALQNHARKYQIPIDTLNFSFEVLTCKTPEQVSEGPEDGIYVNGLFINSARWDDAGMVLMESLPNEMNATLPVIHFKPSVNPVHPPDMYLAPLYKTSVRAGVLSTTGQSTNYVLSVSLPTTKDPNFWVLQGTALLCAPD